MTAELQARTPLPHEVAWVLDYLWNVGREIVFDIREGDVPGTYGNAVEVNGNLVIIAQGAVGHAGTQVSALTEV